jgi:enoyl-[acyl-carrier protein] reductase I
MIPLKGKRIAVLGVADRESLAWKIALSLREAGAEVRIGYQQRFLSRVRLLLQEVPDIQGSRLDVLNGDEIAEFFSLPEYREHGLDGLVHSIAFGAPGIFSRPPSEVTERDFSEALDISVHSLSRIVREAAPVLNPWASVVTLSFQASQRAMPLYGMMGVAKSALESLVRYLAVELGARRVRVNTVSPGPIETLAALSEIVALKRDPEALERLSLGRVGEILETLSPEGFRNLEKSEASEPSEKDIEFARLAWRRIQEEFAARSAIRETLSGEDVTGTVAFLLSDASRKMTGQVLTVDCGFSSGLSL